MRASVFCLLVVFALCNMQVQVFADKDISDYGMEFLIAEAGAVIGGAAGFVASRTIDSDCVMLPIYFAGYVPTCESAWMWHSGRALGAAIAISLTQSDGNIPGAFLLSGLWALFTSFYTYSYWQLDTFGVVILLPGLPALLSIMGYNLG